MLEKLVLIKLQELQVAEVRSKPLADTWTACHQSWTASPHSTAHNIRHIHHHY